MEKKFELSCVTSISRLHLRLHLGLHLDHSDLCVRADGSGAKVGARNSTACTEFRSIVQARKTVTQQEFGANTRMKCSAAIIVTPTATPAPLCSMVHCLGSISQLHLRLHLDHSCLCVRADVSGAQVGL